MEKKNLLADKDIDSIKKDLEKDIKKLKPKTPRTPASKKRVEKMAQKKVDTDMEDLKGMLKDELIIKYYKDRLDENKDDKKPVSVSSNTPVQNVSQQPKTGRDGEDIFDGIKPKDLKGVKDDALEKYIKLKVLAKNPELAPYLKEQPSDNMRDKILDKMIEKAFTDGSSSQASKGSKSEDILTTILGKLLDNAFNQNQPAKNDQQLVFMKEMHEREMQIMERLSEEREARLIQQINDLRASMPQHPLNYLAQKKEEQEMLRSFFAGSSPADLDKQLAMKQQDHKHELELLEIQNRLEKNKMEQNKGSEFTNIIKDGIDKFGEKFMDMISSTIGKMGKEQLENMDFGTVDLAQIEQEVNNAQLPQQPNPFQQLSSDNMFNPQNANSPLNQQYSLPPSTENKNAKKYPGGFTYHGS